MVDEKLKQYKFFSNFEIKGKFDTGLKFFKVLGSRDALSSEGFTMAFFGDFGIVPTESDKFITFVKVGRTTSMQSKRRVVGIGSRLYVGVSETFSYGATDKVLKHNIKMRKRHT